MRVSSDSIGHDAGDRQHEDDKPELEDVAVVVTWFDDESGNVADGDEEEFERRPEMMIDIHPAIGSITEIQIAKVDDDDTAPAAIQATKKGHLRRR